MKDILLIVAVAVSFYATECTRRRGPLSHQFPTEDVLMQETGDDPGEPLFLTPYIEKGDIDTAQKLSKVGDLHASFPQSPSYSGFLTVNKTVGSNLFFWYFPSQRQHKDDPVLLWLQGGPGGSSLFGLFAENGPFGVDKNNNLIQRKFSWNVNYHVVYIDNPVGTGFSFTKDDSGYNTNEGEVAENMYSGLAQFFKLFPNLKDCDFYLTGESYAGKYIPAIAYAIHTEPHPKQILLRGVAIGDGWTDPLSMVPAYADYMYQVGLLDENQSVKFRSITDKVTQYISQGQYTQAFLIMNGAYQLSFNASGIEDTYNYLRTQSPADMNYYNDWLKSPSVRAAIHVGSLPYQSGEKVELKLMADVMNSEKEHLAQIMNHYKVLLYSGQLDVIVAHALTDAMLQALDWVYADEYKRADRAIWKVHTSDVEVAGYVRRAHDFYRVLVRGGGHILPYDQPERSWDLIDRFISGRPFA